MTRLSGVFVKIGAAILPDVGQVLRDNCTPLNGAISARRALTQAAAELDYRAMDESFHL